MKSESAPQESSGRILALDLGDKRIGAAVCDELRISIKPLDSISRSNWKQLLRDVAGLIRNFDAKVLVVGLPLSLAGEQNSAAQEVQRLARNFARSLSIPVYLQDERLTSIAAVEQLRAEHVNPNDLKTQTDSQAAALILADFLTPDQKQILVSPGDPIESGGGS